MTDAIDNLKQVVRGIMRRTIANIAVDWEKQLRRKKLINQSYLLSSINQEVIDSNGSFAEGQVSALLYGFWLDRNRYVKYNDKMPNIGSLSDWVLQKGLDRFKRGVSSAKPTRISERAQASSIAFAIAKTMAARGSVPRNRNWIYKTFWNHYETIVDELYLSLTDAEFLLLEQHLNLQQNG